MSCEKCKKNHYNYNHYNDYKCRDDYQDNKKLLEDILQGQAQLQAQLQAQAQIQAQGQAQNDTDTISNVGNPVININTSSNAATTLAYGTFWQTSVISVPFNSPFPFDQTGPTAGGVSLANPTTISVLTAGDYKISFVISINTIINPVFPHNALVALFLNNNASPIPNAQASFGLVLLDKEDLGCYQLVGEAIISIPANSTLQLKNISFENNQTIVTCDSGINAVTLSLQKLN